ncbi:hypothetical protein HPB48_002623 [Haemaphysalis longicornis]|uniref:Neurotransmitter-gated ion-channel ligand-binding domain-containing protein n=1 Tax=Haemaphysalis longicornis TaxID=44386 RepID=A0A9J6G218_HAELO|nr:hypothetical protein HPB48_002623 [Haemaphysalis longicornis]
MRKGNQALRLLLTKLYKLPYLDKIFEDYDKAAWPTYDKGTPTLVRVSVYIITLGPINTNEMTYNLDIHLQQSWSDPRLNLLRFGVNKTLSLNGAEITGKIWKPDLYFVNAKRERTHKVTMPNQLVDITPRGDVYYTMR